MVPPDPTAHPWLESRKKTEFKDALVGLEYVTHWPFWDRTMVPPSPTAHPSPALSMNILRKVFVVGVETDPHEPSAY
jgi:hypothetical protein